MEAQSLLESLLGPNADNMNEGFVSLKSLDEASSSKDNSKDSFFVSWNSSGSRNRLALHRLLPHPEYLNVGIFFSLLPFLLFAVVMVQQLYFSWKNWKSTFAKKTLEKTKQRHDRIRYEATAADDEWHREVAPYVEERCNDLVNKTQHGRGTTPGSFLGMGKPLPQTLSPTEFSLSSPKIPALITPIVHEMQQTKKETREEDNEDNDDDEEEEEFASPVVHGEHEADESRLYPSGRPEKDFFLSRQNTRRLNLWNRRRFYSHKHIHQYFHVQQSQQNHMQMHDQRRGRTDSTSFSGMPKSPLMKSVSLSQASSAIHKIGMSKGMDETQLFPPTPLFSSTSASSTAPPTRQLRLITSSITWSQYLWYFFTLRLEHAIDKTIQMIQYLWYKVTGKLDRTPSTEEAQTSMVQLLWYSSLVTCYEGMEFHEIDGKDDVPCLTFRFYDYKGVHNHDKEWNLKLIEVFVPQESLKFSSAEEGSDLIDARCKIFVNGVEETVEDMYAVFYFGLTGSSIHPRIHALAAWISKYKLRGGVFEKMHIFTNTMNDSAASASISVEGLTCPVFAAHLHRAIGKGMWKHDILKRDLFEVNRFVYLVSRGRQVIKKLLHDMDVGIDAEIFIAGSLLHSLDHTLMFNHTSFTRLLYSKKYDLDARCFAFLFVNCTRGWIVNTRMSNPRNEPWIAEIFAQLQGIDKEFAQLTHYCISW